MVNVLQYKRIATNTPYKFFLLDAICRSLNYKIKTESLEKRVLSSLLPDLAEMYNMSILDLLEKDTPFYNDFSKISNCFERFYDLVWGSLSESDRLFVQFRRNEVCFRNIAQHNLTKKICFLAVQRLALNIIWTPDNCKTSEMCEVAVKKRPDLLAHVPDNYKTPEMWEEAVAKDSYVFKHVPPECRTEKMCLHAVRKDYLNIQFVPAHLITPEIREAALSQSSNALTLIRSERRDVVLSQIPGVQYPYVFKHVPPECRTEKMCLHAVRKNY